MDLLPKIHWLASYPKSGNTWVRMLLYAYKFGSANLEQMKGHVIGDQIPGAWFSVSPVPWGYLNNDQRLLLRHPALMMSAMMYPNRPVIMKTHCANLRVNSIDLIPEELTSKSVYIVRDPRDVCISYAHHMGISIDEAIEKLNSIGGSLSSGESGIVQAIGSWSANVKSWNEDGHFDRIIIRYEDLLSNPIVELRKILTQYYDIEPEVPRMQKAIDLCTFSKLQKQEQEEGFSEATKNGEFFRKGKSSWRETLTSEQISTIEKDHSLWMVNMGYELTMEKAA